MTDDLDDFDPAAELAAPPGAAAGAVPWAAPPSVAARAGVQRAVDQLLDALAPEKAIVRGAPLAVPVERYRTPRGCILQGAAGAVTVSWFPDGANDAAYGSLEVLAWRGVVSRPGSAERRAGAVVERELRLHPAEAGPGAWSWRAADGTTYDTAGLAAHCLELLRGQQPD